MENTITRLQHNISMVQNELRRNGNILSAGRKVALRNVVASNQDRLQRLRRQARKNS